MIIQSGHATPVAHTGRPNTAACVVHCAKVLCVPMGQVEAEMQPELNSQACPLQLCVDGDPTMLPNNATGR